jgi:flavin-dependent dehydrogenase
MTFAYVKPLPSSAEVVVVGGGLAGAGAACLLAQAGREVLVLEREAGATDKICGEFLSIEAQHYLRQLGLDLDALGGHPTTHLRLIRQHTVAETALPFIGLGLSRRRLDEALLNHARQCGALVERGQRVCDVSYTQSIELAIGGGGSVRTNTLFLATGKHDLRSLKRHPDKAPEDLVGFKMYFAVDARQQQELTGHVELVLFAQGYAGLQPVEDGQINLCLLAERTWLHECGGTWDNLLQELLRTCPHLKKRLSDAKPLLPKPLSIYRVPYGFVHDPASDGAHDSIYRLGDQVGVISSFSGDGMGIALHSAALAASTYLAGFNAAHYHRLIRHDIAKQIHYADMIYHLSRWGFGQHMLMGLARLNPRSLQFATSLTRIPAQALARVSL